MNEGEKENNKEKHQFRSYYCGGCKQKKPCQLLASCCACYYHQGKEKSQEYLSREKVFANKQKEQENKIKQLKLLREYAGCKECKSKEVDAYELYEENKLVCQPCRIKKEGGASGSVSFLERQKWFKKRWKIELREWLNNYDCLPINANCAEKWLKDKEHLNNCKCLEEETQELCELFTGSLQKIEEKLKKCACETSEKVRVGGDYYTWCEICEESIAVASKKRVIKNRNDPKFWGLKVKEKVLCRNCLEARKTAMKPLRKAEFNRYRKAGRL